MSGLGGCPTNCLVSGILGLLLCKNRCKIDSVAAKLAYFPPQPATYKFEVKEGDTCQMVLVDKDLLRFPDAVRAARSCEAMFLNVGTHRIPAIFFPIQGARFTILFSHSNAMDLGILVDFLYRLSARLKVSILCYEYTGYGISDPEGGKPSEQHTFRDIDAAFRHLTEDRGIPGEEIVLYGQSVGSGPSCYLASRQLVRGVVLHGALASGLGVVSQGPCCAPSTIFRCCDIYRNVDRARDFTSPTLVMHGDQDEVISFSHGVRIHKATRGGARYDPYWVAGGGHNNLMEINPQQYLATLDRFFTHLQTTPVPPAPAKSRRQVGGRVVP